MPVLKSYVNNDGYYINARPPDIGNITYQVHPSLWTFLEEMGYRDESEVEWSLVRSFRMAGLVYTEGQGVDDNIDEDIPELDPTKLSDLSENGIQELMEYIDSRDDLDEETKRRIRDYILDNREDGSADFSSDLQKEVEAILETGEFEDDWQIDDISMSEEKVQHWLETKIEIRLREWFPMGEGQLQVVHIFTNLTPVDQGVDDYLTTWKTNARGDITWRQTLDVLQQKAVLAKRVTQLMRENGYTLDDPENALGTDETGFIKTG